jgi:hypothetical protein
VSAGRNTSSSYVCYPNGWHYDILRVLHYLREAGVTPEHRMAEAIGILESKRGADGRWPPEHALHDELLADLGEREDEPNRWLTLRALCVLRWAEGAGRAAAASSAASS